MLYSTWQFFAPPGTSTTKLFLSATYTFYESVLKTDQIVPFF